MKYYFKFDKNGYYTEPIIADYNEENPMPDDVTDIPLPQPNFKPKFDKKKNIWVETGSPPQPSIEVLQNQLKSAENEYFDKYIKPDLIYESFGFGFGDEQMQMDLYDVNIKNKISKLNLSLDDESFANEKEELKQKMIALRERLFDLILKKSLNKQ